MANHLYLNPSVKPYRQGRLLEILDNFLEADLPRMLRDPSFVWEDLLVNYEAPRVDRLWGKFKEFRVYLHRIYPCSLPYKHIHPWPSAIRVLSGTYEMEVGTLDTLQAEVPQDAVPSATIQLSKGSSYEMLDPKGWHSVRPLREPSLSVMLTGVPWFTENPFKGKGQGTRLHARTREEVLEEFRKLFPEMRQCF